MKTYRSEHTLRFPYGAAAPQESDDHGDGTHSYEHVRTGIQVVERIRTLHVLI